VNIILIVEVFWSDSIRSNKQTRLMNCWKTILSK